MVSEEYFVRFLGILRQRWNERKDFSCLGHPKEQHLLLLLDGCSATYHFKSGKRIDAKDGEIVYTPKGSEYKVVFDDFKSDGATVGINFLLYDENGAEFSLAEEAEVFPFSETTSMLFKESERIAVAPTRVPAKFNSLLYRLLSEFGEKKRAESVSKSNFRLIEKALVYLAEHFTENTPIEELAKLCSVSAVYFRKLFKLHTGYSPTEYRIKLRMLAAKEYLRYGELSVGELSTLLGYNDAAYFIKQFKEEYSVSPHAYRVQSKL